MFREWRRLTTRCSRLAGLAAELAVSPYTMLRVNASRLLSRSMLAVAACFFFASFMYPTMHLARGSYISPLAVLLFGWGNPAWYANLTAALGVTLCRSTYVAAAVVAAITTLVLSATAFSVVGNSVLTDEGGGTDQVTRLGVGAYFWMVSMLAFALHIMLRLRQPPE